nr:YdiU family protein [Sedimentibacter sp.]
MTDRKYILETGWNFDNSYLTLPDKFYTMQKPTPAKSPGLIVLNYPLARSLGLNIGMLQSKDGVEMLSGSQIPEGAMPIAQAYAGHQFGYFTMLGDGRAVLLGEQITPRSERLDIQLKGSGETPYSRNGDGKAALGPMLREFIMSEAMHSLGIETTRSLAVVTTGERVYRESPLEGAILTRVALSHIRVGTFQYAANWGTIEDIRALADYTIKRHYPIIENEENKYLSFLKEVINRQAMLISKWMLTGFIHGVMNTDNMAISGETIDYGPCAFMDDYDPETVFSSIDRNGRYAYGNQPKIAEWNLSRFAETMLPLIHENKDQSVKMAQDAVDEFSKLYNYHWMAGMRAKLGFFGKEEEDEQLINELLDMMNRYHADFTNTFRALTLGKFEETAMSGSKDFSDWLEKRKSRLSGQQEGIDASIQLMKNSNPSVIPRNHRVEEALSAAVNNGDYSVMENLLNILSKPYAYSPEQNEYVELPAEKNKCYKTYCGT